ncbi:MAG: DNA recombination protein RmuC [Elusimicrobiota bacterium]|nr:DNA recombination protein RmuC [Elusimicrobiota bacterium]
MTLFIAVALTVIVVLLVVVLLVSRKPTATDQSLILLQQQIDSLRMQLSDGLQSNSQSISQQLNQVLELVNNQLGQVNQQMMSSQKTVGERLDAVQKTIGERLDTAAKVVGDVQRSLGSLSQATERVFEVGKDIARLQEILRAPKLRGALGELFLGDLLAQILPPEHFSLQYKFKSGEQVDAVVRLGTGLVPVDSKFPLENFRRIFDSQTEEEKKVARKEFIKNVKKHIDDIAKKYILPDEGTFDFALMYIPAENVYYETIIRDEISDERSQERSISSFALERRVIPVSPNSFYAYLQAIVLGLKGLRIEKNAEIILVHLERLKGDFDRFKQDFEILGKHISAAKSKFDDTDIKLTRFEEKLLSTGENQLKLPAK